MKQWNLITFVSLLFIESVRGNLNPSEKLLISFPFNFVTQQQGALSTLTNIPPLNNYSF